MTLVSALYSRPARPPARLVASDVAHVGTPLRRADLYLEQRTVKVICMDMCMAPPSLPWRALLLTIAAWLGALVVSNATAKSPATASATLPALPGRPGLSRVRSAAGGVARHSRSCARGCRWEVACDALNSTTRLCSSA